MQRAINPSLCSVLCLRGWVQVFPQMETRQGGLKIWTRLDWFEPGIDYLGSTALDQFRPVAKERVMLG